MAAPKLTVNIQGQGSVNADQLNTLVLWCSNVSQLRSFVGLPHMTVYLQGLSVPGDGGQGSFYWQATVTETDDGANYIIPLGGGGGGWVRIGPVLALPIPTITGQLSAVTDANAKAVLTSIISALVQQGIATSGIT